jgi:hypothetical protein
MCTIILLKTSVWPSVWGWKVVDFVSLVSNIEQRLDQNVLRNLLSSILDIDRLWDPKVYPHSFKEEFSSGLCYDILLVGCHNGHL